jgi:ParB-like chromosome segregation protein Spo0J
MADHKMPSVTVRVDQVVVGERHRKLNQDKVNALVESIGAFGLMHPISVVPLNNEFMLVAGWHRFEAVKRLGWVTIPAVRAPQSNRELVEIDENLARAELTPDELRDHIQRRKVIWRAREVEAKAAEKAATVNGASCAEIPKRGRGRPKGFATQTAAITGKSKSQINRLAKPKAKKKPKAKSKAEPKPPIETITIAVGIDRQGRTMLRSLPSCERA